MKKYYSAYHIVDTEEEAKAFCAEKNASYTSYMRRKYPSHYTEYNTRIWDGVIWTYNFEGYVCWYRYSVS